MRSGRQCSAFSLLIAIFSESVKSKTLDNDSTVVKAFWICHFQSFHCVADVRGKNRCRKSRLCWLIGGRLSQGSGGTSGSIFPSSFIDEDLSVRLFLLVESLVSKGFVFIR